LVEFDAVVCLLDVEVRTALIPGEIDHGASRVCLLVKMAVAFWTKFILPRKSFVFYLFLRLVFSV
jgi:hypothetical protein